MIGNLELSRTHAQLERVETFLRAARTSPNPESRKRNLAYAREAYEVARRYLALTLASPEMLRSLEERFSDAREELMTAGETVNC